MHVAMTISEPSETTGNRSDGQAKKSRAAAAIGVKRLILKVGQIRPM
jgi:hypothetical protein